MTSSAAQCKHKEERKQQLLHNRKMFAVISLLLVITFGIWCYWRWETSKFVAQFELIPGPPRKWPLLGNILDFPRSGHALLQTMLVGWVKEYGPVYRIWRGIQPIVMLSSPEAIETVISSQKHINKSVLSRFFIPWLGEGLLLSRGEKWREDRRTLTPAFHFQILNDFIDVFNRNSDIFVQQIARKLETNPEIEISSMTSQCTLDIICEAAMGIEINAQIGSGDDANYIEATEQVESLIQEWTTSALSLIEPSIYFNFIPKGRRLRRLIDLVHSFTAKVLKERKEQKSLMDPQQESSSTKRKPFLELLLETNMSDDDIISQVDTFMFEGHDTTAAAITWFLYRMAIHPDQQDRVYKEIYDCFGESDRPCTLDDLPKLKYLECCLKETMRLHPSVPIIRRRLAEEVTIEGFKLPLDTTVQLQIYAVHHDEKHFPDPYAFKPERFLPEQSIGRHPYAFVPFSAGPRNCIGQRFATYEDKIILTNLLRKYKFDMNPCHFPVRETLKLILKPENGMPLLISHRN